MIGTDKPFDATRKLLKVLLPEDIFPVTDKSIEPLEAVADRLDRVAVAGTSSRANWLVVGDLQILQGVKGGAATIALKDNPDFRIEVLCDKEELAKSINGLFDIVADYFAQE